MTKKSLNQNAKYVQELVDIIEPDFVFSNKPINRFKIIDNNEANIDQDKSEQLLLLKERISYLDKTNSFSRKDELVPNAKHIYGDIVFDNLLLDIKSVVEKITNKKLIEQYSYLRLYSPGDVMYKHKDRNSCEYSVSLCIDSNLITLYPLMVEDKNKQINAVCLEPGSAVVYAGTELVHWRDMFLGKYLAQVFLHTILKGCLQKISQASNVGLAQDCQILIASCQQKALISVNGSRFNPCL